MTQEETRYERNPDYVFRVVVEEAVLVPIHQDVADMDCIYTMNPVGAFIWKELEQPTTQADLRAAVLRQYEADPETVASDLESFLQEMVAIGAIQKV